MPMFQLSGKAATSCPCHWGCTGQSGIALREQRQVSARLPQFCRVIAIAYHPFDRDVVKAVNLRGVPPGRHGVRCGFIGAFQIRPAIVAEACGLSLFSDQDCLTAVARTTPQSLCLLVTTHFDQAGGVAPFLQCVKTSRGS